MLQFNGLLKDLTASLTTTPKPDVPALRKLLNGYATNPLEWQQYAHPNPSKKYTRNLVCEVPGVFELLLLVWTPCQESPVHDHADAHCLMKMLQGSLVERRWETPTTEGKMVEKQVLEYPEGKVAYMCDRMGLHDIRNPSASQHAMSLQ